MPLKDLLENGNCFKLVCGAGNEDTDEAEKLTALYSAAGCKFFDVSADKDVINAAKKGLRNNEGYLCVSIGIQGDPHTRKANIDYEKCKKCGKCAEICPQKTICGFKVKHYRCIGCGKCNSVCKHNAVYFTYPNKNIEEILTPEILRSIDCVELHVIAGDKDKILQSVRYINEVYGGILSISASLESLRNKDLISCIKTIIANRQPYSTIIQSDGKPMSGGKNDYFTTLETVCAADIILKEKLPAYLFLSGGTNSKTPELAKMCGINYTGIAVGTYARKIVQNYLQEKNFLSNEKIFNEALSVAKNFVNQITNFPS